MSNQNSKKSNSLPDTLSARQRIALLLEYKGKAYHGSQFQPGKPTVQGALVATLQSLGVSPHSMMFAGRTDAGVHAKGQVAHFDIDACALKEIGNLHIALNGRLPEDIAVRDLVVGVTPEFHSQRHAVYKWYRYKLYLSPPDKSARSAWQPDDTYWLKSINAYGKSLNVARMQEAAQLITGTHCFKSFQCTGTALPETVCDIMAACFRFGPAPNVNEDGDYAGQILNFDIVGNRFLYKMVRSLVGQLLRIGQASPTFYPEAQNPEYILDVLNQQDRTKAADAAPACGLSLMGVSYPQPYAYFESDPLQKRLAALMANDTTQPNASQDPVITTSLSELSDGFASTPPDAPNENTEFTHNENLFCKAS